LFLKFKRLIFASEIITDMKNITINIFETGTSRTMRETITITGLSIKELEQRKVELFNSCLFEKKYYEVESDSEFTDEELDMLDELNLVPDNLLN